MQTNKKTEFETRQLHEADTGRTFEVAERQAIFQLLEKANAASQMETLDLLIQQMLDLMLEATFAESAIYSQYDSQTDEMAIRVVRGVFASDNLIGTRIKRQEGLPVPDRGGAQMPVAGNLHDSPRWLCAVNPFLSAQQRNIISLPLTIRDRLMGLVQIYNYGQADMDILLALADRLAIEVDHRKQLKNAQRVNHSLHALVDAMGKVTGTLDRGRLLDLVMENASHLVEAERVSLFLVDPSTHETMFHIAYQAQECREESSDLPASAQLQEDCAGRRQMNPAHMQSEFNFLTRSAITVPITNGILEHSHSATTSNVLGGLMAMNKQKGDFQSFDAWLLETLARQASTYLQAIELYEGTEELFLDAIRAMVAAIDAKDSYTQGHSQRVSDYSVMIAEQLGMHEEQIYDVRISSLLHDVGKIGIHDAILKKTGKLTDEEMKAMRAHPKMGVNILSKVKLLERMLPGIEQHHERLDGSGYPNGLIGDQISMQGRIIAVADVFDAMASTRPYRPAIKVPDVMDYLIDGQGILFDPQCVETLHCIINHSAR